MSPPTWSQLFLVLPAPTRFVLALSICPLHWPHRNLFDCQPKNWATTTGTENDPFAGEKHYPLTSLGSHVVLKRNAVMKSCSQKEISSLRSLPWIRKSLKEILTWCMLKLLGLASVSLQVTQSTAGMNFKTQCGAICVFLLLTFPINLIQQLSKNTPKNSKPEISIFI